MELSCPDCGHSIPPQHINVITDLAQCPACGALHRLSSLVPAPGVPAAVRQEPPPGSALQLSRGLDGAEVHLPRRKAGCGTFFFMGFALFWLSFVAVWTVLAASASGFFALFSIPFWVIGGGMLLAAVNFITETQTVRVTRSRLVIDKKQLLFSKSHSFEARGIQAIRLEELRSKPLSFPAQGNALGRAGRFGPLSLAPAVQSGSGTVYFFENANSAEQEWIVAFLKSQLAEV
ncbi:MAG: hypothetical protein EOO12_03555 [Chitinophagaceae bacterium]|nr:MAG: hypothetical protein EOO12_03555 [Chitinophagaceae bacterium]